MAAKNLTRAFFLASTLVVAAGCTQLYYTEPETRDPNEYEDAAFFLETEINDRIYNLEYQADGELYQNMKRLVYIGEPAIPYLLEAMNNRSARVRGSSAYILGLIQDRRTIGDLAEHLDDDVAPVRYEVATSLCVMGDNRGYAVLIKGLTDDDIRNRFKAHEALQLLTRLDFGYAHDAAPASRNAAIDQWQEWYTNVAKRDL